MTRPFRKNTPTFMAFFSDGHFKLSFRLLYPFLWKQLFWISNELSYYRQEVIERIKKY